MDKMENKGMNELQISGILNIHFIHVFVFQT